ncbi:MAG: amino acid adenylation domain-containing protein [Oscillospiraceae bacterium]|nr:amino acid adenylation domain-containing protein [Oscillospiraceae bacterium]
MAKMYLMSSVQKRLFSLDQIQEKNITYNIPMFLSLSGKFDVEKFDNCIKQMIKRHEVFRTRFEIIKGKFVQIVEDDVDIKIEHENGVEHDIPNVISEFVKPFDLKNAPLMRIKIFTYSSEERLLLFDIHHIIMDGVSIGIFLHELMQLYNGFELPELKIQYKDYSAWLSKQNFDNQREYWKKQFADGVPQMDMPLDFPRTKTQSFQGDFVSTRLDPELSQKLLQLGESDGATEYMSMLAVFMIFLSKYSYSKQVVVGTPIAGRNHPATQGMLGMFVNTLAITQNVDQKLNFTEFLTQVKETCFGAFDNQDYLFEQLVEDLNANKAENRNPIFDVMFTYLSNEKQTIAMGDAVANEYPVSSKAAKFDLTFSFGEADGQFELILEYNVNLFKRSSIQRMLKHFATLLKHIVKHPEQQLSTISCTDEEEFQTIAKDFNNTVTDYPRYETIHSLFESVVESRKEQIALMYEGKTMTYGELDNTSDIIANILQKHGVKSNDFVGIVAERNLFAVSGLLGILKSGGAYLPLDPHDPPGRTRHILDDCNCMIVLGPADSQPHYDSDVKFICIDDPLLYQQPASKKEWSAQATDLAYLMYTSGTTGKPKGVMIEHRSVVRLVKETNYFDPENLRILQTGSLTFDASTFEIWGALLNGGFLLLVDSEVLASCALLKQHIREHQINTMWLTSSLFNQMISLEAETFDDLKCLLIGGEKLSEPHVQILLDRVESPDCACNVQLVNGYGPTECTTFALTHRICQENREAPIPIGKPISNTTAYVMDGTVLCGIGMPGELCLGGDGLARGYFNREELTREKFIDHPYELGERLYRTGDLTRLLETGEIEFLGRIDDQIKIRGFRIELSEISNWIMSYDGINNAATIVDDSKNSKLICAYFTATHHIDISALKTWLNANMPAYMIPSSFTQLEELPVTKNGKLLTSTLPRPQNTTSDTRQAPENEVQEMIATIFTEILNCGEVCIDASFFDLGGDSIKAIQLISKLREQEYEVRVKDVLSLKTVRAIANVVERSTNDMCEQGEIAGELKLSPIQSFFYGQSMYAPAHFNQSFMLETSNEIDLVCLRDTFRLLLQQHDALRAVFPDGKQVIRPISEYDDVEILQMDLSACAEAIQEIESIGNAQQAKLNIEQGPLIKAVVYQTTEKWYLQIIVHHLIVDGISWRILLEDINSFYHLLINKVQPTLPPKTSSYKAWVDMLSQYSQSAAMDAEMPFWQKTEDAIQKNQTGHVLPSESVAEALGTRIYTQRIPAREMEQVFHALHGDFDMNSLLIFSLAKALQQICGIDQATLFMEGHGRETLDSNLKIERTVGWFTCAYPLTLQHLEGTYSNDAKLVKDALNQIPNSGIGYGIANAYRNDLKSILPDVTFNYLGEFALQSNQDDLFSISEVSGGADISSKNRFGTPISVNSIMASGELWINVGYDADRVQEDFIKELAEQYIQNIKTINSGVQPKAITNDEIYAPPSHDYIKHEVIGTYLPSAMETMFFELEDSWVTIEQSFTCQSPEVFQDAIHEVIRTQSIFRTSYMTCGLNYQLIEHDFDKQCKLNYYDIRYTTPETIEAIEKQILDAENDLQVKETNVTRPLYLMSLKRSSEQEYHLRLRISHCIWDKQSDGLLYETVKNALQNPGAGRVISNFAFRNATEQARASEQLKQSDIERLQEFAAYEEQYKQLSKQQKIVRFDTAVVELGELREMYAHSPYNVIAHLTKAIVQMNSGYCGEKVPLYLVVENRKYVKGAYEDAIGLHLDVVPVLLDAQSNAKENDASDCIADYLQLKRETGINIMDQMRDLQENFTLEGVCTLNIQTGFGLTDQQLLHIMHALEHKKAGTHYEILANEYKEDRIVLAYPVTDACKGDIKQMLQEICQHDFVTA